MLERLAKRLAGLRAAELDKEAGRRAVEEERIEANRLAKEREALAAASLRKKVDDLQLDAENKFGPILEVVNRNYCGGSGHVSKEADYQRRTAHIKIVWDGKWIGEKGDYDYYSENSLEFETELSGKFRVLGGGGDLEGRSFLRSTGDVLTERGQRSLEKDVIAIVTNPARCRRTWKEHKPFEINYNP